MSEQVFALHGIMSGTARHWRAERLLTHVPDYTERGLAMQATQPCRTPNCPDPGNAQWRPVTGYEGIYEVSSHGDVRRVDRYGDAESGRPLSQKPINRYRRIGLWRNNQERTFLVHVLVAKAFIGAPPTAHHEV